MLLIATVSTLLVFATVKGSPTTTKSITTTQPVTDVSKVDLMAGNGTNLANDTDSSYAGVRDSLEKDISYLRSKYQTVRQGLDDWMEAPYHRNVVIPVIVGVMSAGVVLILYRFVIAMIQRCKKRFSRTRISYMTRDYEGERQHMIPKREESDE